MLVVCGRLLIAYRLRSFPVGTSISQVTYYTTTYCTYHLVVEGGGTYEDMAIDVAWDISSESSYQLPSEPRRSVLSWPTTAMLEGSDQGAESYPSAIVLCHLPLGQASPSLLLSETERITQPTNGQRFDLPPDIRSTPLLLPSNLPSQIALLQDRSAAEDC
jgi:hypothetical protein